MPSYGLVLKIVGFLLVARRLRAYFRQRALSKRLAAIRRTILISGAASGIGLATARLLLSQSQQGGKGWFVGLYDVNREALDKAVASLAATYSENDFCAGLLDVTDATSCQDAVKHFHKHAHGSEGGKTNEAGGPLHVVFNCAGILAVGAFADMDLAQQVKVIDVNFSGLVKLTHAAVPSLRNAVIDPLSPGHVVPRVVNVASLAGAVGVPSMAIYSATKHAVRAFTEALHVELGPLGILAFTVNPPIVQTPMALKLAPSHMLVAPIPAEHVAQSVLDTCNLPPDGAVHQSVNTHVSVAYNLVWLDHILFGGRVFLHGLATVWEKERKLFS